MTSKSGSADVLDALGVRIDHDAASAGTALRELGFAFLFAPTFHPAMRHAGPTRREIGVRTAFNLLGPLTNPAGAKRQLIGVADPNAAARIAEVLHRLGTEHALVVNGDGVDELPLDGSGIYYRVTPDGVTRHTLANTWDVSIRPYPTSALAGGTPEENAAHIEGLFYGPARFGAAREVVVLNAAAGLFVGGAVDSIAAGVDVARDTIDAGKVGELIDRLRAERKAAEAMRAAEEAPA
jgi:anthranilate phosphoribosyltransferase